MGVAKVGKGELVPPSQIELYFFYTKRVNVTLQSL